MLCRHIFVKTFTRPRVVGFVADLLLFTVEKYPGSLLNSPDACARKPYPDRKSCGFKNIRIRTGP